MIIKDQVINKAGIPLLKRLMHVTSTAQKLTASNISNVSVPGYKCQSLNFKEEMQAALKKKRLDLAVTHDRHMPPLGRPKGIKVISSAEGDNSSGVNSVDIDKEMAALAENQIIYSYGSKMLMRKFAGLKKVIRGKQ